MDVEKKDVQVGSVYVAWIRGKRVNVRILVAYKSYNGHTHYRAYNLSTRRNIVLKSSQKLIAVIPSTIPQ